jgi:indole-3-glycerol phosphate synthase
MTGILERIVAQRQLRLAELKQRRPENELRGLAEAATRSPLDFVAALQPTNAGKAPLRLIAEVKRRSPSMGDTHLRLDVAEICRVYASNGAAAVSVLTEPDFFAGSLADLVAARVALSNSHARPLLMKDFIVSPYQIYQAALAGADAVLLIAACLEQSELADLLAVVQSLGLAALVEVHSPQELERVLPIGPGLIGVNNRDLRDFQISLDTTLELAPLAATVATVVSESGIFSSADVERLAQAGVSAILVGGAILGSRDPATKVRELAGGVL